MCAVVVFAPVGYTSPASWLSGEGHWQGQWQNRVDFIECAQGRLLLCLLCVRRDEGELQQDIYIE